MINGISIKVYKGFTLIELMIALVIISIIGANGAGKTSLLNAICGLAKFTGEIVFQDKIISGKSIEKIAKLGIAYVTENKGTFRING